MVKVESHTSERPITIYGAFIANLVIAAAKLLAALMTHSSAMLAESIHSFVDVSNEILLLFGIHRSKRPADDQHPFGYGKEIYFWGLIVALLLFSVGGGMSIYEGITHIEHPVEIADPKWNYLILGIAFIADSTSWLIGMRQLLKHRQRGENVWQTLQGSKDPSVFTVVGEDTADILGILTAFGGIFLSHQLNNPLIDGIASFIVGVILITVAIFLANESKSLIVGESANKTLVRQIRELTEADPTIAQVNRLLTMQFGPKQVLINMEIRVQSDLSASQIITTVERIKQTIRTKHPQAEQIFIEANSVKSGSLHQ